MRHSPYQYEQDPHEGFGALAFVLIGALVFIAVAAIVQ